MTTGETKNKQQYIASLHKIAKQAICDGQTAYALKAHELIGKAHGFFQAKKQNKIQLCELLDDIDDMSSEDIKQLISQLKV